LSELYAIPGCRIERVMTADPASVVVAVRGRHASERCPDCRRPSRTVHSYYQRRPAELPILGREVRLDLRVRRFVCRNAVCPRRTFAERLPALLPPRARRTRRLADAQCKVGIALGGEAGARLLSVLGMPTSPDTLIRLVRRTPLPARPAPPVLGVDDWALKKGRKYGTILVDLGKRHVVDLLPDRTSATFADWLKHQPGISIIARDRSTEYARGATMGAPGAVQVVDRWHLLSNVRQMVERWLASVHARLRRLPPPVDAGGESPVRRVGAFPRSRSEAARTADSRARRLALYEEVQRRSAAGEKLLTISRTMGLARGTVRKYAFAESFPEWAERRPARSIIDPYLPYLEARVTAGCENASELWREVRAQGFTATPRQIRGWLRTRRTAPAKTTPHSYREPCSSDTPGADAGATTPSGTAVAKLPSPKQLAWLLVRSPGTLSAGDAATLEWVGQDAEAARVAALVRRFVDVVRACGIAHEKVDPDPLAILDAWIADASGCGVAAVETFAAGLEQDGAAVRAALTLPWSSGQAEGQITKLKLIKRQMYGRGSFELLRRRLLLAA
jgi:transposase